MAIAKYEIKGNDEGWSIHHEADCSLAYVTREAALEAAAVEATNALRMGHGVVIIVDPPVSGDGVVGRA